MSNKSKKQAKTESKAIRLVGQNQNSYAQAPFEFAPKNSNIPVASSVQTPANEGDKNEKVPFDVPAFYTFWNLYQCFDEVVSAVNLVSSRVASLGVRIMDGDEEVDFDYSQYLAGGKTNFIKSFVNHYMVFGQAIPSLFKQDKDLIFRLIPSHKVILWRVSGYDISHFNWYDNQTSKKINQGTFKIYKEANISSQYFGKSQLECLYDELNSINLDQQSFNKFLENNSFFGAMLLTNDGIEKEEFEIVKQSVEMLKKQENRYKATVLAGIKRVEQIKQNIEHKLTIQEKQYIKDAVYNVFGIPSFFAKGNTGTSGGLGQGEQTTHRQNLNEATIEPMQKVVEQFFNEFLLPIFAPDKNYKAVANQMVIESKSEMLQRYSEDFKHGIWTAAEVKQKGYGIDKKEISPEDHFRIIPNNVIVVKEGNLQQGDSSEGEVAGSTNKKIESTTIDIPSIQSQKIKLQPINLPALSFSEYKSKVNILISKESQNAIRKQVFSFVNSLANYNMKEYSVASELFQTEEYKNFQAKLQTILKQLYRVRYPKKAVSKKPITEVKSKIDIQGYDEELYNEVQEQVNNNLQTINRNDLALFLYFFGQSGKQIAITQATDQNQPALAVEKIQTINKEMQEYASERIRNLFSKSEGEPKQENKPNQNLTSPELPKSVIDTTVDNIYTYLSKVTKQEYIETYGEFAYNEVKNRSENIAETEATKTLQVGFTKTADQLKPKQKQWLPTVAKNPREAHKPIYYETVDYDKPFSIGYMHPNTELRCQCGERLIF
jgi:Phage portal protein